LKIDRELLYEGQQHWLGQATVENIIRAQLLAQGDDQLEVRA
jgi:hypothetical protein